METRTVTYRPEEDAAARAGWYLRNRDRFIANLVRRAAAPGAKPGQTVLDAGCGIGTLARPLLAQGFDVTGVEADSGLVAWEHHGYRAAHLVQGDVSHLPFADRAFDIVVCSEVLEHIPDDVQAVRELLRVARGPVVITVPAHAYLWTDSDRVLLHQRRYSRASLQRVVAAADGRVMRLHAFGLLPGLAVLAYGVLRRGRSAGLDAKPLAARFAMPGWLDRGLGAAFRADLWLAAKGLLPWGHAWWAVIGRA